MSCYAHGIPLLCRMHWFLVCSKTWLKVFVVIYKKPHGLSSLTSIQMIHSWRFGEINPLAGSPFAVKQLPACRISSQRRAEILWLVVWFLCPLNNQGDCLMTAIKNARIAIIEKRATCLSGLMTLTLTLLCSIIEILLSIVVIHWQLPV